ncbi:hypothetical protein SCHPADRAFT_995694 [Schizopora paradoxa]|uniref:PUB domain-containing protein n=1 Tax=Schizopora paradoxa TaxID=27342 RepID=A0A0H2RUJ5_9AGAM|nr:hypothetical protein SCHPADRAFT_995694 [Schizopora paradoxa]
MSATPEPGQSTPPSREAFIAAAEARSALLQAENAKKSAKQLAAEHEVKQAFRRLIDPGIMRPNSRETALEALKTLHLLSENVLREPRNPKYASFKPTNSMIKRKLVDVKGAIEYAVALGFHSVTQNFQPTYAFNPRHLGDMRVGNEILKERLDLEEEKNRRAMEHKETEKERKEAVARSVQLAYADDRKTKAELDEREVLLRQARAANPQAAPEEPKTKRVRKSRMPSAGMTLEGKEVVMTGAQPAADSSGATTRHGYTAQDEDDDGEDDDDEEMLEDS